MQMTCAPRPINRSHTAMPITGRHLGARTTGGRFRSDRLRRSSDSRSPGGGEFFVIALDVLPVVAGAEAAQVAAEPGAVGRDDDVEPAQLVHGVSSRKAHPLQRAGLCHCLPVNAPPPYKDADARPLTPRRPP